MITNLKSRREKLEIDRSPLSPVEQELIRDVRSKITAARVKKVQPAKTKNSEAK